MATAFLPPEGFTSRRVPVLDSWMHVLEAGEGRPLVFLHGNPTSSYLWRHVLAGLDPAVGRRVALDLIGMGGSGKPDIGYHLGDHVAYVEALLDELGLTGIVVVAHDWGVAIALEYLRRRPDRVEAVAFMEGHLRPLTGWDDFDPGGREIFRKLRTPGTGEQMVLEENFMVDALLPAAIERELTAAELDAYRRPFPTPVSRRPLLQWAREIPIAGEPAGSAQILSGAWSHLTRSQVPKLLLHGRPGAVVTAATVDRCRRELTGLQVIDVGPASHFLPEDRPAEIVQALTAWLSASAR